MVRTIKPLLLCSSFKKGGGVYFEHGIPVVNINATLTFFSVSPW
jgi:hypothetical protein